MKVKQIFSWLFLFVLVCFACESLSWCFLFAQGWSLVANNSSESAEHSKAASFSAWAELNRPFPLFGYTHFPEQEIGPWSQANNFGFASTQNFPYVKKENEFVVGLFGGSVAEHISYQFRNSALLDQLRDRIPALTNKKIVFLNLALGGYQQPQSFYVFSYFAEMFDMIIHLDGWNEAWIGTSADLPYNFPAFSEVLYSEDPVLHYKFALYKQLRTFNGSLQQTIKNSIVLSRSATLAVFTQLLDSALRQRARLFASAYDQQKTHIFAADKGPDASLKRVKSWEKYTRLELLIAKKSGIKSFFFIQPSQYAPHVKVFTKAEQDSVFNAMNGAAYPTFAKIRQTADAMREQGLPVYDLGDVFVNESQSTFIDNCCHLTELGNSLVAQRIVDEVVKHWGP